MAKGKRSTALFDVMHAARKPVSDPPGGFAMPKWWGKRATKTEPAPPPPPAASVTPVESVPESPMVVEPCHVAEIKPTMRIVPEAPVEDEPLRVDPIEREVRFKLSYGGAAAAGFILVVILLIAYLAGARSQPVDTNSSAKPDPTAAVRSTGSSGLLAAVTPDPVPAAKAPVVLPSMPAVATPQTTVVAPAADGARQVGRHYVIAQSYPDQEIADKAMNALNKAGIACTVVKGLPGWASPTWYSVVGVKAFDHIQGNDELIAYKKKLIEAVSDQFAGRSAFNRFDPREYKWRAQSDPTEVAQ